MINRTQESCLSTLLRLVLAACLAAVLVAIVAAGVLWVQYQQFQDRILLEEGETKTLVIPQNTSWPGVVDEIGATQMIDSVHYFDAWGRQTGLAQEVRAGRFVLEGPLGLEDLAEILRRGGRADEVVITFREGLTIFDMADRVEEAGLVDSDDFLAAARNPHRFSWASSEMESLEGYLYPETYRFFEGTSAAEVIDRLVGQWQTVVEPVFEEHQQALQSLKDDYDFDRHDIVIMASIIERESSVQQERDVIARVFYNRLDRQMMLQTDPSCVYGEHTYDQIPRPEHCHDPLNRYSTYVIDGLPPGPIANPSRASIEAALLPSNDPDAMDYLFFVSRRDGTGSHYFSETYDEHRRAIQRYLID